ncbi:carboxypeptidase-like regulatory domain-containing protein, partial [Pontibacter sp. H249]|uniref:carboxypeptidase-like regulatory domain-containing protein n=1 Tax=Pontibacter sp. H249 TaxID=3133420 RepID=UPI0030C11130
MKLPGFILILFCLVSSSVKSQVLIKGYVTDSLGSELPYVNVLLKDSLGQQIITYTATTHNGNYQLKTSNTGRHLLVFSALGFSEMAIAINISSHQADIVQNISLNKKHFELKEVTIAVRRPVTIKKDTVIFDAQYFSKGNEAVVEDLLKKIPGITVEEDGTIRVGNKEVEKVMVEGDDFFEKGYKIITKNMPAQPIEQIELLQNYSNNELLKDVEKSDKVAINLKLKEEAKRQWFTNINLGYGISTESRYTLQSNVFNFGKKNKYYFLTNINNIGYDATGDIDHLIRPQRADGSGVVGNGERAYQVIDLSATSLDFKRSRISFNDDKLLSLNAIFNLTQKLKIKALGFINLTEKDFFRNSVEKFQFNQTSFTNTDNYHLNQKSFTNFFKIDLIYSLNKNQSFEATIKYNSGNEDAHSKLLFNELPIVENLRTRNQLFDQSFILTTKFKNKNALLIKARYIDEKSPQLYQINQFFYQDLFPDNQDVNNTQQQSKNNMLYGGLEMHYLKKVADGDVFELKLGNQVREDLIAASLSLKDLTTTLEQPTDFQNNTL